MGKVKKNGSSGEENEISYVKMLLDASRSDAFLIGEDVSAEALKKLDLRLVQSFKRSGASLEVKFVDIAKLCELADRAEQLERERAGELEGVERLRDALAAAAEDDDEA